MARGLISSGNWDQTVVYSGCCSANEANLCVPIPFGNTWFSTQIIMIRGEESVLGRELYRVGTVNSTSIEQRTFPFGVGLFQIA
jgi:hypothetical protein